MANDIRALERKISILDKIALSSEQECKIKEQEVHELTARKNRIEKLIATILSDDNEDYTKLKAIIKENIKAILSDNKKLIPISFVALIQTIKADPQIAKLIQNMPSANDAEQHKDNDNNITQYFESNKDRILNLAKKNYENLVQALTNNAIDNATAAASSSNPYILIAARIII